MSLAPGWSGAMRPTLWLVAGYGASAAYLYGTGLVTFDGPLPRPPPPLAIPQAVALPVLLLTPRRYWGLLVAEYGVLLVAYGLWLTQSPQWVFSLGTAGAVIGRVVGGALVGALLVGRLVPAPLRFDTLRAIGLFASSTLAAAALSATLITVARREAGVDLGLYWRDLFLGTGLA